jgi:uncharacterized protein YxeA
LPICKIKRENRYEETRKYWKITEKNQDTSEYEYAITVYNNSGERAH